MRVLRYASGAAIAVGVAMGFGWPLSFVVPLLALSFLSADKPLRLKAALVLIVIVGIACCFGLAMGNLVIPYPLVFVPLEGLVLFWIFYAGQMGQPKPVVMLLLLTTTVIPLISLIQPGLAVFLSGTLFFDAVVAVIVSLFAFAVLPDPVSDPSLATTAAPAQAPPPPSPLALPGRSSHEAFRSAVMSTLVVTPLLTVFYLFEATDAIVVLVMVAILSSQPEFASSFAIGKGLILGNIIGGITSIVMFEVLVMVPELYYLIMLTLLLGLFFGERLFSDRKVAPLFGMAFSTTLLIIGSVTSSDADASGKVYTRVVQIGLAVVYVVLAFGFLNRLFPKKDG